MPIFSRFFNKGSSSALGVDIGSSAIKVVEIEKKNAQAVLKTYGELALGPYANFHVGQAVSLPPEKIAQALSDLMREKEVAVSTRNCGVSIPFSSSLMTVIELPEVSSKQLSTMVPLEARKYIPVPISEVMLDWSVIPRSEAEPESSVEDDEEKTEKKLKKIDVLIVAIHNETLAKYQNIVTKSGLNPSFFEIELFSTLRSVLGETLLPVMIIDIGAASTKIYVVERSIIRSSHTINRGSQEITTTIAKSSGISVEEAEILKRQVGLTGDDQSMNGVMTLVLNHIFAEVNSTILAFEKKQNKSISTVILVGGGSALKGLSQLAKESLKTEVSVADPFSKLATPAFLENILKETGPEFAVAIGLALRRLSEGE